MNPMEELLLESRMRDAAKKLTTELKAKEEALKARIPKRLTSGKVIRAVLGYGLCTLALVWLFSDGEAISQAERRERLVQQTMELQDYREQEARRARAAEVLEWTIEAEALMRRNH